MQDGGRLALNCSLGSWRSRFPWAFYRSAWHQAAAAERRRRSKLQVGAKKAIGGIEVVRAARVDPAIFRGEIPAPGRYYQPLFERLGGESAGLGHLGAHSYTWQSTLLPHSAGAHDPHARDWLPALRLHSRLVSGYFYTARPGKKAALRRN